MKKHRKFKQHQAKQKKLSKKVIYSLIIAGIMIFSILGFTASYSDQQTINYEGFTFKSDGQKWVTKIDGQKIPFYYLPQDVEYIVSDNLDLFKYSKMTYLTFDPNQKYLQAIDLIRFELIDNFINLNIYPVSAVTLNDSLYDLPIITCLNSSVSVPVIEFRESNETKISIENHCIILESESEQDFIKLKDLLLYKLLNILE